MILFKTAINLSQYLTRKSGSGSTIGFVPTMGALHAGHLSLIESSKKKTILTVCSIFVNPTQFNDPQDFAKYPVTLDQDIRLLEAAGCDIVFLPSVEEIYPNGTKLQQAFDIGYLENILEGKYRPGHFQGVCQVMYRLLEIVKPAILFLGQKDYQQSMVIKKLISISGWDISVSVIPTLRERSGLALSSRNLRLSEKDKMSAAIICKSLLYIKENIQPGVLNNIIEKATLMINDAGFEKTDYITIADVDTLEPITHWNGETSLVALVAAFISGIRLIDNMVIT